MSTFDFGIVTPIFGTNYSYIREMVNSVNRLSKGGITFEWSIVIDGDKRDVETFLKQIINPQLLQNCSIESLDKCHGPSFSRNLCVKALDCDFLCWLDADDTIDIRNFKCVINELKLKDKSFWDNYDLVYTDSYDCDSNLTITSIRKKRLIHKLHCKYKNTVFDPLLGIDFVYQMQIIRRKSFLSIGGFNEKQIYGEDVDLILRVSELSKRVNFYHIPLPVYYYRDNPNGRCNTIWEDLMHQMENVYLESSKRQNFSFREFKYSGPYILNKTNFCKLKSEQYLSKKPAYDIYQPFGMNNHLVRRSYIREFSEKT